MSTARHEYDTGAVRSADCDNIRYDLITPIGLRALAKTYAEGAEKFGAFNWENGMPVTDLLNHAIAHIYNFLGGDRSEDHLAHAAWNVLGAIHSLEMWPTMNAEMLRGANCVVPRAAVVPAQNATAVTESVAEIVPSATTRSLTIEQLRQALDAAATGPKTEYATCRESRPPAV
jgi:hypothetical protein